MEDKRIKVGIMFGGQSAEHDISLRSTASIYKNLDRTKYRPILIFITRNEGRWHLISEAQFEAKDFPIDGGYSFLPWLNHDMKHLEADIYFPVLHGPNGEDGKVQALLELAGKPFVGANSLSSGLAMDKVLAKILFREAGLKIADFLFFENPEFEPIRKAVSANLTYPVFVKPSSMGSSVGISRVTSESDLKEAVELAFRYDRKILIEKGIEMREIEVSVMGNDEIMVSRPGELVPFNEFYDYNDKYMDGKTTFYIPAAMEPELEERVREVAGKAYKALSLNGMSRVDLFIEKKTLDVYVNEINTIPGFTEISMFPKLWTVQGISFSELLDRLIEYGFKYSKKQPVSTALHEGIRKGM